MASADCVIEEITVTKGYAVCKVGDSVKKGDLLISGVIPSEFGSQYCYAEGTVVGRIKDEIVAECGRNYTKKEPNGEKTVLLDVKIFDFIINIFKKYGNIQEECDIIRDVKTYSLFGKSKLPFEVYTESITEYREKECSYTDSEIIFAAGRMLERKLNDSLRGCDLLRLRTEGEFTDGGYLMRCEAVYLTEVGEELSFAVE